MCVSVREVELDQREAVLGWHIHCFRHTSIRKQGSTLLFFSFFLFLFFTVTHY